MVEIVKSKTWFIFSLMVMLSGPGLTYGQTRGPEACRAQVLSYSSDVPEITNTHKLKKALFNVSKRKTTALYENWYETIVLPDGTIAFKIKGMDPTQYTVEIFTGSCDNLIALPMQRPSTGDDADVFRVSGLDAGTTAYFRLTSNQPLITGNGQTGAFLMPPPNHQDCPDAIPICQDVYSTTASYSGTGNIPNEINPSNSCLLSGERNDVWYTFTVQTSGQLNFLLTPNNLSDDYDWAVYNLTNANCSSIYTTPSLMKSCNYSLTPGTTGPNGGSGSNNQGAIGTPYNNTITVIAGQTYVINISNFSASNNGYTIDFSASTAQIYDNIAPQLQNLITPITCGATSLTMHFSENILCSSIQDADFTLTGPGGPYTISGWTSVTCASGGNYDNTITVTISPPIGLAGNYNFCLVNTSGSVTDLCGNVAPTACLGFSISSITSGISGTNVNCFGGNNGTATAVGNGGTGAYAYQWSPSGGSLATATGLSAGTYTVTVTDGSSCSSTSTIVITQPAVYAVAVTSFTNASCSGGNNGSATALANGGTAPFSYAWSGGAVTATAGNLSAGTYTVTATDNNGCTSTASVTIGQPPALTSGTSTTPASCNGSNTGSATVVPNGGSPPYTYLWSNGSTSANAVNLNAGTYTATVTDGSGCTTTASALVGQPTVIAIALSSSDASCNGGSDGSASAVVFGGTGPYSYSWSSGAVTSAATSLSASSYTVTVTDANGCTTTANATVNEPSAMILNTNNTSASCGTSTGSASVNVSGGTPGYSFLWSNGATTASASNIPAGSYDVTVTDANGCTITANATVSNTAGPLASLSSSTDASCNGSSDGSATVSALGGLLPYSYAWSSGGNSATKNNLAAGTYTATVTDANGCTSTLSVTINEPTAITINNNSTDVLCSGGNSGSIVASANGGTTPYLYNWSNGNTSALASGLSTGTYTVTVTDGNGCTNTASASVSEPAALALSPSSTDASCNGGNDGTVSIIVNGGTGPYSFAWSTGSSASSVSLLSASSYTVTVTDANGCSVTATATVNEPAALALNTNNTSASCGTSTGSASVNVNGGTAGYSFLWSNGATMASMSNIPAGSYDVTVTDANGCTATANTVVSNTAGPVASLSSSTDASCNGSSDGSATVSAIGGLLPYSYAWSSGGNSATKNNLAAGTYTATVTDASGCTSTLTVTINEPAAIAINCTTTDALCSGGNSGSISAAINGGTSPFSYLWSNGSTSALASGLSAGAFTVTVTDGNGCTNTVSATVSEPAALALAPAATDASCNGGSDGSVSVVVNGGTGPYAFAWSSGSSSSSASSLSASSYTVTVTDANGCTASANATVNEPSALVLNTNSTSAACGTASGSASVNPSGGTAPFSFLWSNGNTTASNASIAAGPYDVTVTDANGCTSITTVNVPSVSGPAASISASTDVSCNGGSNGTATATANGGALPYTWLWSNGSTTSSISNVPAGNYTVTVTDASNCVSSTTVQITEPSAIVINATITDILCNGDATGSVSTVINGGTAPYSYLWSIGNTNASISLVVAGTYSVTVTDAGGCSSTASSTVSQPSALALVPVSTDASCNGTSDGSTSVTANGGTGAYGYLWSNGDTNDNLSGLSAGSYTVTVTDANGCTDAITLTVNEPSAIILNTSTTSAACGTASGSASVNPSGGTAPFSFLWSNGNTTASNASIAAGPYDVTVTDANGCTSITTVNVPSVSGPAVSISASTDVSCNGGSNGSATAVANGGALPYTWLWSNGSTTSSITNVPAGNYTVTVTDASNCVSSTTVQITEPSAIVINTTITDILCNGDATGSVSTVINGGTAPYSYLWSIGNTNASISLVVAGTYTVTVTDAGGCSSTVSSTVSQPAALALVPASTDASCNGTSDGSASVSANGGTGAYGYLWSNGDTNDNLSGLSAGSYTVTVTDASGCTATAAITISEPAAIAITKNTVSSTCGAANGSATATPNGGTAPYSFLWSTGATTSSLTNVPAGIYSVTVTDANSCTGTRTIAITNSSGPVAVVSGFTDASCNGNSDGSASVGSASGALPLTYLWSNGSTLSSITNIPAGTYTATITDANNCSSSVAVPISEPAPIVIQTQSTDVLCNGGFTGTAHASANGGTGPYSYSWSNGSVTDSMFSAGSGNYTVTVTDVNGCTLTSTVTINQPVAINLTVSSTDATCNGLLDGTAMVGASGGNSPYSFIWSNGNTTDTIQSIAAGTYTITVYDATGCSLSAGIQVNEPAAISITKTTISSTCGAANGGATATPNGGTNPYSFLWSTGATTGTIINVAAGAYSVTVTDANGCTATRNFNITNASGPTAAISGFTDVSCNGYSDGSVSAGSATGSMPFTYVWSNGSTSAVCTGLTAGTYTATVTDANGCSSSVTHTINEPAVLTMNTQAYPVLCNGASTGSAAVSVNGGTTPYSWLWSNASVADSIFGSPAGNYFVTVTDAHGCTLSASATITQSASINLLTSALPATCNGGSDGTLMASANGGIGSFSFLWSNGASVDTLTGVAAGTYTITVTDASGCTVTGTVSVGEPAAIVINTGTVSSTCGSANGSASAGAAGGNPSYSFLWSTGATGNSLSGILAATYTVTVTDASGCTASSTVTVINTSGPSSTVAVNDVSCHGFADASATCNTVGGLAPYSYTWSNGMTTAAVSTLDTGNYQVVVTDANGCSTTVTFTVQQPQVLTTQLLSQPALCNGGNSGLAFATAAGGTAPYQYSWSTGSITDTLFNLVAGAYTVTVTDSHGCTVTASVSVTEPVAMNLVTSATDANCFGSADGSLQAVNNGGTAPYTYQWSNAATGASVTGVGAGIYTVTVTDQAGCTITSAVTVSQPTSIQVAFQTISTTCGASNGSATANASGGSPGYSYLWSNGSTLQTIQAVVAGTYTVTVTDLQGCTVIQPVSISDLAGPLASVNNIIHASCFGYADGSATAVTNGGSPPFTYLWSNTSTSASTAGLAAGTYTVTITDQNGCQSGTTVVIQQPALLQATVTATDALCFGTASGTATAGASGGTSPYFYNWSNGTTGNSITNLGASIYSLTLTDDHGCTDTASVSVGEPTAISLGTTATPALCFGSSTGTSQVTATGGTGPYQYLWSSGSTGSSASNLPAGNYTVTVTDANGCQAFAMQAVTEPPPILIQPVVVPVSCFGGSNGTVTLTVNGGIPGYSYQWSTGSGSGTSATGLPVGTYTVTVTDANSCTSVLAIPVTSPPALLLQSTVTNITCYAANNGIASVIPSGGVPPYSYSWSNGSTAGASISNLAPATYTVTVTDQNGCTAVASMPVAEPAQLLLNVSGAGTICIGQSIMVSATSTGGTGAYSYTWSNGCTTASQQVSPVITTDYTVNVTDANNCTTTKKTVTITVYPALSVTATASTQICAGESVTLTAQGSGGNGGPYTYTWDNSAGNSSSVVVSPFSTTTYVVTVSDNCGTPVAQATVTVLVNPLPVVQFGIDPSEGCIPLIVSFTDQTITSPQAHYYWDFGDGSQDSVQHPVHVYTVAGVYDVTLHVISAEGCESTLIKRQAISTFGIPDAAFIADPWRASILHPLINFEDRSAGCINWDWDFGDGSGTSNLRNPQYYYGDTGTYTVRLIVENDHACKDTVYEQVVIEPDFTLYIPNAFTPNGDGKNETFSVSGIGITDLTLLIYNRWGKLVFTSDNLNAGWNGRVNNSGMECQQDTYVYLIKAVTFRGERKEITGKVSLIR